MTSALDAFSIETVVAAKATDLNREIVRQILREGRSRYLSSDLIL